MPWPALLVPLALAAGDPGGATAIERLPSLVLAVENPRRTGRRLLHLDDLIGPAARPRAGERPRRALLLVALDPRRAQPGGWDLAALGKLAEETREKGGEVIGIVLGTVDAPNRNDGLDPESVPFVITRDPHGLARRRLDLVGGGRAIVVRSDGRVVGVYGPARDGAKKAKEAFLHELEEEQQ
ncbi:MAG: hypothetical protein IT384_32820 [Deltaproteobacteria bacterium]|nr:hypothetical protein [Deltaproteobacteria bacterium]